MKLEVILKVQLDDDTAGVIALILSKLTRIEELLVTEQELVAQLAEKVAAQGTVVESAVTLLAGLSAAVRGAKDVSPEVLAIIDQVDAQTAALAKSVLDNTPAAAVPAGQ